MADFKKSTFGFFTGLAAVLITAWLLLPNTQEPESAAGLETTVAKRERSRSLPELSGWLESPAANLEEGIALAKQRGTAMGALIRTDPERAIREALSLSEWMALPPEIQAHVEQPFSALANVEVLISCGENTSETSVVTTFSNHGKMETFVYGRRNGLGSKNGTPVQGIRLDGIGVLRESIFQSLDNVDEAAALKLFPVAMPDPGGDSIAALAGGRIFYFEDQATFDEANARLAVLEELPGPNAGAQALFDTLEEGIIDGEIDFQALEEIAYAASTAWTGTPRDMYVIMVDLSDLPGPPTDPAVFSNSLNTAISQQIWDMSYEKSHIVGTVNPTTYRLPLPSSSYTNDYIQLYEDAIDLAEAAGVDLSSYETVCVLFPDIVEYFWAGRAALGGSTMWLNGSTSPYVVVHELGHNYGAHHASSWTSTNNDPDDMAGTQVEYGDFLDIMGSGSIPKGHFNAWHKKRINWFDSDNWESVGSSGTYRVYRSDHRQTTQAIRGLEIQKGGGDVYWIGLRQEFTAYEPFGRGAYLLWKKSSSTKSILLDTTPQSAGGKQDGGLVLGQTYSDTTAGVHITPTARGGQTPNEWMDISVNLGSFPGNTAPTASLSGPTNVSAQSSVLFSVAATDSDGDELAYFWDIGDGLVKPNASSIAAAWVSGSTVTVSCVVSDMKGGTNKVSQTVALSSPLDNWTQRTSGTTVKLNDIAYGNGRLVAVGRDYTLVYSDDGTNWTEIIQNYVYLDGVIYDGTEFIAVGTDYDFSDTRFEAAVLTSPNGITWTRRYLDETGDLNDVAFGGGIYVAVGEGGVIIRSTDGISWSTTASGTTIPLRGVSYGGGVFVAVGALGNGSSPTALVSTNGISWSDNSGGVNLASWTGLYNVQYCNDRFLAGGWYARILGSMDLGETFTTSMTGDRQVISALAYGNGTYFAAGINKDDGNADINLISLDGVTWTELTTSSQDDRNAAVYYDGTFITVGDNGSIWQSDAVGVSSGGFAGWQLENSALLGFNRDPLDDADFDGSVNLEEYARGTSAVDAGTNPSDVVYEDSGSYFQVSYERDGIKSDIDYNVERITNLASNDWSSASTVVVEDSASNLTVRSAFTMSSQTNEFMQLKIQLQ
jgi:hypothetical protein